MINEADELILQVNENDDGIIDIDSEEDTKAGRLVKKLHLKLNERDSDINLDGPCALKMFRLEELIGTLSKLVPLNPIVKELFPSEHKKIHEAPIPVFDPLRELTGAKTARKPLDLTKPEQVTLQQFRDRKKNLMKEIKNFSGKTGKVAAGIKNYVQARNEKNNAKPTTETKKRKRPLANVVSDDRMAQVSTEIEQKTNELAALLKEQKKDRIERNNGMVTEPIFLGVFASPGFSPLMYMQNGPNLT